MKEATGELNMTVITVVAIAAIAAVFYAWVWPSIQNSIRKNSCESECAGQDYKIESKSSDGKTIYECKCGSK